MDNIKVLLVVTGTNRYASRNLATGQNPYSSKEIVKVIAQRLNEKI